MIKISLIGIVSILFGVVVEVISIVQWFFRFPDPSQLYIGTGIGLCFMSFGYIHSWMRSKDEKIEGLGTAIDALRMYQVDEFEKLNKKITIVNGENEKENITNL